MGGPSLDVGSGSLAGIDFEDDLAGDLDAEGLGLEDGDLAGALVGDVDPGSGQLEGRRRSGKGAGGRTQADRLQRFSGIRAQSWGHLLGLSRGALGRRYDRVRDVIGTLRHGEAVHVVSMGEWSMEHAMAYVLDQIGPAHVRIASWAISTDAAARLVAVNEAGLILSLRFLFDWKMKAHPGSAKIYHHLRANVPRMDLALEQCHAKVYVLWNDLWNVAMVSSANMTTNARIEAFTLTEDPGVARFHREWIDATIDQADPFEAGELAQRTNAGAFLRQRLEADDEQPPADERRPRGEPEG